MRMKYFISMRMRYFSNFTISPQMRTWQIYKYGDLDQLTLSQSYQTPAISLPNQILVKVKAASVNPIDLGITKGYGASAFNILKKVNCENEFPITMGRDFSGTVVKVGRSVHTIQPGMEVIGAMWPFQQGCHADYVVCCQSQLAIKPSKLTHCDAAALPYAGLTAYSALIDFGGLKTDSNKRVLILGSGGGVGTLAVQIAKFYGAHVTVTCRAHSEEMLMRLGADDILPDKGQRLSDPKFDIILDCIGANVKDYAKMLSGGPWSRFVTIKHSLVSAMDLHSPLAGLAVASVDFLSKFVANAIETKGGLFQWAFFRVSQSNLATLCDLADRGALVPVVHARFDFVDTPEAYRTLECGSVEGKVVIEVSQDEGG